MANTNFKQRIASVLALVAVFAALNASGALAGFWRTLDNLTSNGVNNPEQYLYGYGYGDNGWGYGYGYGYGYPKVEENEEGKKEPSRGGGGGGGWTPSTDNNDKNTEDDKKVEDKDTNKEEDKTEKPNLEDLKDLQIDKNEDGTTTITKTDGTKVTFSDIGNTFATEYIAKLAALGIVNGYEDGTFRPENNTSRAEYLKMVLRGMGINYDNADTSSLSFKDVEKDSWIAKVVTKAVELEMIDANNINFRPNASITRAESMKMLLNAAGVEVVETETSDFSDVSGWATKYIQTAKNLGIVDGQEINGKKMFRPQDSITRAEVSKIVVKTMELK